MHLLHTQITYVGMQVFKYGACTINYSVTQYVDVEQCMHVHVRRYLFHVTPVDSLPLLFDHVC